jgi:hypothetical protein
MRSFSLSFSVSSSLSSCWRGSSSKKKKTFTKKKKTNRCRQTTSRNFTVASLKSDENDDDDDQTTTTTTTPVGMVVVKEEAKEKTIESSRVDFAMPNRLLSSENLTTVRVVSFTKASRLSNFKFFFGRLPFIFSLKTHQNTFETTTNRMKLKTLDFERTRYTFARDSRTRRKKAVLTGNNRPR